MDGKSPDKSSPRNKQRTQENALVYFDFKLEDTVSTIFVDNSGHIWPIFFIVFVK